MDSIEIPSSVNGVKKDVYHSKENSSDVGLNSRQTLLRKRLYIRKNEQRNNIELIRCFCHRIIMCIVTSSNGHMLH